MEQNESNTVNYWSFDNGMTMSSYISDSNRLSFQKNTAHEQHVQINVICFVWQMMNLKSELKIW